MPRRSTAVHFPRDPAASRQAGVRSGSWSRLVLVTWGPAVLVSHWVASPRRDRTWLARSGSSGSDERLKSWRGLGRIVGAGGVSRRRGAGRRPVCDGGNCCHCRQVVAAWGRRDDDRGSDGEPGRSTSLSWLRQAVPLERPSRPIQVRGRPADLVEPAAHCSTCRRDFFPLRPVLQIDAHGYSPVIYTQVVPVWIRRRSRRGRSRSFGGCLSR